MTTATDVLFQMARHMGMPIIVERGAKWEQMAIDSGLVPGSCVWDGHKLVVQHLNEETLAHEIAHWMVANSGERELVNYGLHDSDRNTEPDPVREVDTAALLAAARGIAREAR